MLSLVIDRTCFSSRPSKPQLQSHQPLNRGYKHAVLLPQLLVACITDRIERRIKRNNIYYKAVHHLNALHINLIFLYPCIPAQCKKRYNNLTFKQIQAFQRTFQTKQGRFYCVIAWELPNWSGHFVFVKRQKFQNWIH